uniref:Uncharacterized protein n=1 Tax=Myotis myotis TaxID=51298 RepID=A0A7J8AMI8_MYOMY|nr:hypothetical protein mMyoMyo1_007829 [Myotis myotis]
MLKYFHVQCEVSHLLAIQLFCKRNSVIAELLLHTPHAPCCCTHTQQPSSSVLTPHLLSNVSSCLCCFPYCMYIVIQNYIVCYFFSLIRISDLQDQGFVLSLVIIHCCITPPSIPTAVFDT